MAYKEILETEYEQFHKTYRTINKQEPYLSKSEKTKKAIDMMVEARLNYLETLNATTSKDDMAMRTAQYIAECNALTMDTAGHITRFYLKDEELFDFFENTELSSKTVDKILTELSTVTNEFIVADGIAFGIMGKKKSYCLHITKLERRNKIKHVVNVLNDKMNFTFIPEDLSEESRNKSKAFKLAMNFLLYIKAYPEMIIDGVPNDVKKDKVGKQLAISPKVVSHTTSERGITRTHFRSGHFRHLESDYYKNKKGQVIFVAATIVKGKAKTVIRRETA